MNQNGKNDGVTASASAPSYYDFVELNRTFHELSQNARQTDEFDLSEAFHMRGNLAWPDLLKEHRVVILSEAGSGKTEEIRQSARKLRAEGKTAFFLRLEHIPSDLDGAFEVGSLEEFETWLKSEDEAWLFLDSVDEARLKSPGDFAAAVRKLATRVKLAMQRVHVVITGRTHAWRPKSDADLCDAAFPYGAPTQTVPEDPLADLSFEEGAEENVETESRTREGKPAVFKIVGLDDLNREQIEKFARSRGVKDTKAFIDDLDRADAWSFTGRPQDLQEVVSFWLQQGRIGSRIEIMQSSIERRLTERSQDRADTRSLSADKARQGAQLLAAATTLTHDPTLRVPDGTENKKGIALRDVLSDWDGADHQALLSLPIFDAAIYGTVRFHHRSVREYLTAEWLAERLQKSASRREVENLLFRNQYGMDVAIPTMRPVLPWLAILDDKVRERLRKIAPEVLFEGGDSSALPLPTRKEILADVCDQIANGRATLGATSYSAVQRFSNHDIAADIKGLLRKYSANDELCGFLLRMVWLGRLEELLPEATEVAFARTNSRHTQIAAFRAVNEIGDADARKRLRDQFLNEAGELDRELLAELISAAEPSKETVDWLLGGLAKAKEKEEHSVDRLADSVANFVSRADIELVAGILQGLRQLLSSEPFIDRGFCHVSKEYAWLGYPASVAAQRLIAERHQFALNEITLDVLFGLRAVRDWRSESREILAKFSELIPAWPELNRTAFWHDVAAARARLLTRPGDRLTYYGQAAFLGAFWSFGDSDFDYACEQIAARSLQDDKLVALSLAFALYVKGGRTPEWRTKLKDAVGGNTELVDRLATLLKPPAQKDPFYKENMKWKGRAAAHKRREKQNYEKSKKYLTTHVDVIRDPKLADASAISQAQWYLHERLREKEDSLNKWTGGKWENLIAEYGENVAKAYRDAVVGYWRRYKPVLQSEGAKSNTVPIMVVFGLTGLGIEAAETPNWPSTLNEDEVVLASRYACHELNGFPTWFPKLFEAWPEVVGRVLLGEIAYELTVQTEENESHYVLSDVSWAGQWSWRELGPATYRMLETTNPKNGETLSKLLKIVEGSEINDADLAKLAARKATDLASTHLPLWFAVWVGADPERAIPVLTARLASLPDAQAQTQFAMRFVTRLFGSRRSETTVARPGFRTAEHLKTLYLLMHKYIRRSEDIERAGKGVYSPELRDDAQEARNKLFDALNRLSGKATFLAMQEIASNHPDEGSRGWLMRLTRQKAEQEADFAPWTPAQVRDFNATLDRMPKNHHELAEVVVLRLLDLKDDFENGDNSIAKILQDVSGETLMRNYIGRELREKAFGRYNIPQEEELADAKRPDLRFLGTGFQGPVPVELKLADNWAGPVLFERLENQLAGDYLRDIHSGRGIFALVYRGEKKSWEHPVTSKSLNFDELVAALEAHWKTLSPKFPKVDDITVIGIDLTKRFKPPKSS
jgi:hypothetical protein